MPDVPGPFVFYGRTSLILGAYNDAYWKNGVFFNPEAFSPEQYLKNWGDKMLNADARMCVLKDVDSLPYVANDQIFVRPNDDLKFFTGGVMSFEQLVSMKHNATNSTDEPINLNTVVVVSSPKEITAEWRLFMIGDNLVTGSQYLPKTSSHIPAEVITFASHSAKEWSPAEVFVMDIALLSNGQLKIIECNCFNGSGFYDSDLTRIVRQVSLYVKLKDLD